MNQTEQQRAGRQMLTSQSLTPIAARSIQSKRRTRRVGFSLLELLVVFAILAILVALLLPAVQQAREAARRTSCKNNLKQVVLALQNYHTGHSCFPPGWIGVSDTSPNPIGPSGLGWSALLLPTLDQTALFNSINDNVSIDDPVNQAPITRPIPTYLCSSDPSPAVVTLINQHDHEIEMGRLNYLGVFGTSSTLDCVSPAGRIPVAVDGQCIGEGAFFHNGHVTLAEFWDGASHTIVVGERSMDPLRLKVRQNLIGSGWGGALPGVPTGSAAVAGTTSIRLNSNEGGPGFSSSHTGGAQFAIGDGSVRFLSENINPEIYRALGTIGGGELTSGELY